ncbi:MAG: response regulator transcription factor [Leptospiraceae bacterium]|nr:response regulator transcription factor [Leptospiraceae bacterium]
MKKRVLLLEDDRKITELLTEYLAGFDYQVWSTSSPSGARGYLKKNNPDIAILDVMLPEEDGFSFLRSLRSQSDIPVIMLTARGELTDRVVGLELGADDYMPKPFEPRELIARMSALLRRADRQGQDSRPVEQTLAFSNLEILCDARTVLFQGRELPMTAMEFDILYHLARNQGIVMSRDRLTELIHGEEFEPFNRTIDILVSRIRHKLNDDAANPKYIRTVRGVGYLFKATEKPA